MNRTEPNFKPYKNRPVSRIICWNCRRGDRQLFRVTKKDRSIRFEATINTDYICVLCRSLGFSEPAIGNTSQEYFEYEKEDN